MSPRSDKTSNDSGPPEPAEAETLKPRRRGRPKKEPKAASSGAAEDGDASAQDGGAEASGGADAGAEPVSGDGRPRERGSRATRGADDEVSADGAGAAGTDASGTSEQPDAGKSERARAGRGKGGGRNGKSKDNHDRQSAATSTDAGEEGQESETEERSRSGRGGRNRRGKGGGRKGGLNFRELQSKIVPELHLLAKEVGLDDYRQMSKDDLALAILERSAESEGLKLVQGYLEISSDGYGFLQESLLQLSSRSVIVSAGLIKQFKLRTGDYILGKARRPRDNERYGTLIRVEAVNGVDPFHAAKRPRFDDLVPTFPEQRIKLETAQNELSARVIDLLAPIGRGQRGLIVAPPKAGKTTLLKKIANSVVTNEDDIKVIVLLVDERPEEVTDFRESVNGVEVIASTFDEPPSNHIRVAEFVHERARRIVEEGGHVMILLDSITRLARANNLVTPPTGRTLSGGLDSSALHWPKRFLGAARNIRGGGSLSILATALVETGSRMDDVIFEEFKGTGNMELHLSRRLEERRIFPAIDILKSGTRREDLLLGEAILAKMWLLRKVISDMDAAEAMEMLLSRLSRTTSNEEFLATLGQG
jgi:transcription termination factor Rho